VREDDDIPVGVGVGIPRRSFGEKVKYLPWLWVAVFYIPLILMTLISLNDWTNEKTFTLGIIRVTNLTLDNYAKLISAKGLLRLYMNTAIMSASVAMVSGVLGVAGGYGMLRMGPRGRAVAIGIIAIATSIPVTVIIIPLFIEMHYLGLSGLPSVLLKGILVSANVIVAWQYMKSIPQGYFDSATIDGANDFQVIWHILIPISKPLFALTAIGQGIIFVQDYLWQSMNLVLPKMQTVVVGMTNLIITTSWALSTPAAPMRRDNIEAAAGIAMLLPMALIFFAGRKQLMNFKLDGGLKE
jgi:ABC-type glycerol-3-phosphate transport system permease component